MTQTTGTETEIVSLKSNFTREALRGLRETLRGNYEDYDAAHKKAAALKREVVDSAKHLDLNLEAFADLHARYVAAQMEAARRHGWWKASHAAYFEAQRGLQAAHRAECEQLCEGKSKAEILDMMPALSASQRHRLAKRTRIEIIDEFARSGPLEMATLDAE